jgi:ATP-binding cassette subfamily B protein
MPELHPQTGPRNDWQTICNLLPYLWPMGETRLKARVIGAILFLILAKTTNLAIPLFYKQIVDSLTNRDTVLIAVPITLLLLYGATKVLYQLFSELRDAVFTRVAQRAIRKAGLKTFRHLHHLSLRFHLSRKTGGISRSIERGTKGIEFLLRFLLFNVLPTLLEVFLTCGILWKLYGIRFALITLLTLFTYIGWTLVITEWRLKYRRVMNATDSEANTKAIDSLLNFETVKYFGNEDHEAHRFDQALKAYESAAVKSGISLAFLNVGQGLVIATGVTASMIMAAYGVTSGTMTIGDFVLINAYLIQLFLPLNFLGFVYREIKHSLTDMEQMFRLLSEHAEVEDTADATQLVFNVGEVRFNNVSFHYDQRRPILKGVSFSVKHGETVAIVGSSGSGKSTISRLLFRFYDTIEGSISIDGQNICNITQASLRSAIGMVPQDTVLFNDTIFYNIAYGRPNASPSEIEEAARMAHIHNFIMALPDGYQSQVGERGLKLSGGEKQRVAIARTILMRPHILIFDEATSALDSQTEQEILASLRNVSKNHTTLTIAHRLSTIIDADEILVLETGQIVERGAHNDLITKAGKYKDMWDRQQEAAKAQETLQKVNGQEGVLLSTNTL